VLSTTYESETQNPSDFFTVDLYNYLWPIAHLPSPLNWEEGGGWIWPPGVCVGHFAGGLENSWGTIQTLYRPNSSILLYYY